MRILYSAIDQIVPGTVGGSIHVRAVAEGLARRGHDVHVLADVGSGLEPTDGVHWHAMRVPLGLPQLRLARAPRVLAIARTLRPDAVIERYYNFGGEAIRAARVIGALAVLEVNAPIVDYPGSPKAALDSALLVGPMARWRAWQCRNTDLFVTPTADTLPASVEPARVVEIEWGADTDRFTPDTAGTPRSHQSGDSMTAVFAGAFRRWHGAIRLVEAIKLLRSRGERRVRAAFLGSGPELPAVRAAAAGVDGIDIFGAVPHESMPSHLRRADVGVAPFDVGAHPPLMLGFYWSPLKVFEYMACGLPVVAPRLARLEHIVRDGCEGVTYDASDPAALANALASLIDPERRRMLGAAARTRVVERFSWAAHCARLDQALTSALEKRRIS